MSNEIERKDIEQSQIDWNEHAEYWDEFEDGKIYTQHIYNLLSTETDLKGKRILDFGCGTGLLINQTHKEAKEIIGLDTSSKMIEILATKKYTNVKALNKPLTEELITNDPNFQEKFDVILAVSVCAFLPNYEETIQLFKSLLRPDGIFIQWDWLKSEKDPGFGFNKELIQKAYSNAGLNLKSFSIPFHLEEKEEKMEVVMAVGTL